MEILKYLISEAYSRLLHRFVAILSAALLFTSSSAQQLLNTEDFEWYCSFDGSDLPGDLYGFSSDQAAATALSQVLLYTGLAQNFVIQAANVDNAVAVVNDTDRYILYNQDFMLRIAAVDRDWAALSILAHEVGHHLQGHTLLPGGSRPPIELEADQYSGFVLERMGASLDQAQAAMKSLPRMWAPTPIPTAVHGWRRLPTGGFPLASSLYRLVGTPQGA
ncbi:MAG: hypothetical protein QGF90_13625 [Gammaproteobacteria bacterium]|nr:hypothetical protein [Gammaproteobacteria bacterium]|tara:strand:- start:10 stop:669 length:660 start_codon:yes stop_codon:yes gene_type:complete